MAQEWCVAYGVLDDDEAIKVDKIICTRKGTKPSQLIKKATSSATSNSSATSSSSSAVSKDKVKKEAPNKKYKYADDIIVDTGKRIILIFFRLFVCLEYLNCISFLYFVLFIIIFLYSTVLFSLAFYLRIDLLYLIPFSTVIRLIFVLP